MRAGEEAFAALRMDVYARADFIIDDEDGEFYSLEMNALPGMTAASLLPRPQKPQASSTTNYANASLKNL